MHFCHREGKSFASDDFVEVDGRLIHKLAPLHFAKTGELVSGNREDPNIPQPIEVPDHQESHNEDYIPQPPAAPAGP